jgi:hypothetical protein
MVRETSQFIILGLEDLIRKKFMSFYYIYIYLLFSKLEKYVYEMN